MKWGYIFESRTLNISYFSINLDLNETEAILNPFTWILRKTHLFWKNKSDYDRRIARCWGLTPQVKKRSGGLDHNKPENATYGVAQSRLSGRWMVSAGKKGLV